MRFSFLFIFYRKILTRWINLTNKETNKEIIQILKFKQIILY